VSFGPFQLGELAVGAIEEVKTRTLREQLGARVAAQAGADFAGPRTERIAPPAKPVVPAKAGTHRAPHRDLRDIGPRLRGDDNTARIHTPKRPRRRADPDRIGQPELARREKRRGRRGARGKSR
jgi:23S rRNA pseudouridine2605 synthase